MPQDLRWRLFPILYWSLVFAATGQSLFGLVNSVMYLLNITQEYQWQRSPIALLCWAAIYMLAWLWEQHVAVGEQPAEQ